MNFFLTTPLLLLGALASLARASPPTYNTNGQMTIFTPANLTNACGTPLRPDYAYAAVSTAVFQNGLNCGATMAVHYNGTEGAAVIVDRCDNCTDDWITASAAFFTEFADESVGHLYNVSWSITD